MGELRLGTFCSQPSSETQKEHIMSRSMLRWGDPSDLFTSEAALGGISAASYNL